MSESNSNGYEESLNKVKKIIENEKIEIAVTTIIYIVKLTIEVLEESKVKGADKKVIATKIIRTIIEDAPISDEKEKLCLDMVDEGIVSNVIDLVVSASKGELNINAIGGTATACCAAVFKR
tara:strand:- start:311 stop:676 length:366 start_codon:yes stop_codon:yes gene_type:complete